MESTLKKLQVDAFEIPAHGSLDAIHVFWQDIGVGQGDVTITCWGQAWTCYFGAMGGRTIRQFFVAADTYYLTNKLGITPLLKGRKADHAYLGRIIDAIKAELAQGKAVAA